MRSLLDIQQQHNPEVFFLSETHLDESRAEGLMRKLRMDHRLVAPSDGRSRGLLLVWKKEVMIYDQTTTTDFIDAMVEEDNGKV